MLSIFIHKPVIKASQVRLFEWILTISICSLVIGKPLDKAGSDIAANRNNLISSSESLTDNLSLRQKIISEFKEKVLSLLKLKNVPDIKAPNFTILPDKLKRLIDNEYVQENDEKTAETIAITLQKLRSCAGINQSINQQCFNISIPNLDTHDITTAKFILPLKTNAMFDNVRLKLHVRALQTGSTDLEIQSSLNTSNFSTSDEIEINCLAIIRKLLSDDSAVSRKETTWRLLFFVTNQSIQLNDVIDTEKVVLEIEHKSKNVLNRRKRSISNFCLPNQYFCCTETLKVTVEDLGWGNFIVAPKSVSINFCRGDCNNYVHLSSNHRKAFEIIKNRKGFQSCCVPYSYSSLTIMYIQPNGTMEVTTLNDVIASSCGCL